MRIKGHYSLDDVQQVVSLRLEPKSPFRLDLTVWALRRRPDNIVDSWDGKTYRRVIFFDGKPAETSVTQTGSAAYLTNVLPTGRH